MPAPPEHCTWAPWWSPQQCQNFLNHVEAVVKARFGHYHLDHSEGTVTITQTDCVLGLSNLAQTCQSADPEEWRLIIYGHIARLDDFVPDVLADRLSNYEQLQPDLRIRVVSHQHLTHVDPVCDALPLGLSACLSVDLNGASCPVDRSYFDDWGVAHNEVMAVGLANTLTTEQLTTFEVNERSGRFRVLSGESLFASGHLLNFAPAVPDIGALGAIVTIPAAHTVMVCPVELNSRFVDDSAAMLAASYIHYMSGPNSVSPNALWWRPNHPLVGFARMETQDFELVVPEPLRSQLWEHCHGAGP